MNGGTGAVGLEGNTISVLVGRLLFQTLTQTADTVLDGTTTVVGSGDFSVDRHTE